MKQARWATEPSFALGALPEDVVDYQLAITALLEMQASCTPTQKIDCLVRVLLAGVPHLEFPVRKHPCSCARSV